MDWLFYAVALPALLLFLGAAACAVHWAVRHGQLHALWQSLRTPARDLDAAPETLLPDERSSRASSQS